MVHPSTWRKLARDEAWTRQDSRCAYCKGHLRRAQATFDHIVPKSEGGTDQSNCAAACELCNSTKRSMSRSKFKKLLNSQGRYSPEVTTCRALLRINRRADLAVKRIGSFG